jgi:hypothetical protein
MAEIAPKQIGEFVRKEFEILLDHPDGMPAKGILSQLGKSLTLTEYDLQLHVAATNIADSGYHTV